MRRTVAVLLALSALGMACSDEGTMLPEELASPDRGIHGEVMAGGQPVSAQMRAIDLSRPYDGSAIEMWTTSTGRYSLPLAPGRYRLAASVRGASYGTAEWVYAAAGPVTRYEDADTLIVGEEGPGPRADFHFGALHLVVHMPQTWTSGIVTLAPWSQRTSTTDYWRTSMGFQAPSSLLEVDLPPAPPGTWAVRLSGGGGRASFWLPGGWDPAGADSIALTVDSVVVREYVLPERAATLRGSVTGSWQAMGLDEPAVVAFVNDSTSVASTTAAADGTWVLSMLGADRVRLAVSIEDDRRWIGGDSWSAATEFIVTPGTETVVPTEVESGLLVRLRGDLGWTTGSRTFTLIDGTGRAIVRRAGGSRFDLASIPNLMPGTYLVHVRPDNPGHDVWAPQWFDGANDQGSATPVFVPGGGTVVPLTIVLGVGGEIRGRAPGAGWAVYVTPAAADTVWGCSNTQSLDAGFRVRGLADGSYKIGVARDDEDVPYCDGGGHLRGDTRVAWYGSASWDSATVVTIRDHGVVDGIEIETGG